MAEPAKPWTAGPRGVVIALRLTPRGGRDAIEGVETLSDGRKVLKVRVRATPSDGEANAALMRLLADALSVRVRDVELLAGASSRIKRVAVAGDAALLGAALDRIAAAR